MTTNRQKKPKSSKSRGASAPSGVVTGRLILGAASLVLALSGCSTMSDSLSDSISKSVSSPFEWSSKSSGTATDIVENYRNDVGKFAEICARSHCSVSDMNDGVTTIAGKYGITDWEAEKATYDAIGRGFAKAHLTQAQVDLYKNSIPRITLADAGALQQGYDVER